MSKSSVPYSRDAELSALGACLLSERALNEVTAALHAGDFHVPDHAECFEAIRSLQGKVDEITLKEALKRRGRLNEKTDPGLLVLDAVETAGIAMNTSEHVRILRELGLRRRALSGAEKLRSAASNGTNLDELAAVARGLSDELSLSTAASSAGPSASEIDDFLNASEPEHDWLVPDVMEMSDRMIITGREGGGKSVLEHQIGVQVAAGVHPFREDETMDARRVLIVDLENSERDLRWGAHRLRAMRRAAGDRLQAGKLFVVCQPAGIDVAGEAEDRAWLATHIEHVAAELVIIGPLYKLADGDPNEEKSAKPVVLFLDELRARFGCALILEAHMPHDGKGRPYGWSGWRRWPDIGLTLTPTDQLVAWRPARHETPGLPPALKRGGKWPFTVATRERDVVWARIVDEAGNHLTRPSIRELAAALETSRGNIGNVLKDHAQEWEALFDD